MKKPTAPENFILFSPTGKLLATFDSKRKANEYAGLDAEPMGFYIQKVPNNPTGTIETVITTTIDLKTNNIRSRRHHNYPIFNTPQTDQPSAFLLDKDAAYYTCYCRNTEAVEGEADKILNLIRQNNPDPTPGFYNRYGTFIKPHTENTTCKPSPSNSSDQPTHEAHATAPDAKPANSPSRKATTPASKKTQPSPLKILPNTSAGTTSRNGSEAQPTTATLCS